MKSSTTIDATEFGRMLNELDHRAGSKNANGDSQFMRFINRHRAKIELATREPLEPRRIRRRATSKPYNTYILNENQIVELIRRHNNLKGYADAIIDRLADKPGFEPLKKRLEFVFGWICRLKNWEDVDGYEIPKKITNETLTPEGNLFTKMAVMYTGESRLIPRHMFTESNGEFSHTEDEQILLEPGSIFMINTIMDGKYLEVLAECPYNDTYQIGTVINSKYLVSLPHDICAAFADGFYDFIFALAVERSNG